MKKYIISFAVVALALCSCSREEKPEEISNGETTVYQLDMHLGFSPRTRAVSFGDDGVTISSYFAETDCIYIYNETKQAFARTLTSAITAPLTALHPSNISGPFCDLTGSLTFYVKNADLGEFGEWQAVSVDEEDTYSLFYQMNLLTDGFDMTPSYTFYDQRGGAESVSAFDFAESTGVKLVKTASTLSTSGSVYFENLQSMFRLRLSYAGGDPESISSLAVNTKNNTLIKSYLPTGDNPYTLDGYSLVPPIISNEKDVYLSLAFFYDSAHASDGDELILTAIDNNNNIFQGSLTVPSGGFKRSRYYYGAITLAKQEAGQTVTRNDGGDSNLVPDDDWIDIYAGSGDYEDLIDVIISGSGSGLRYYFNDVPATVTLSGASDPVTSVWAGQNAFIESDDDLIIILDCNYQITNIGYDRAIESGGTLKLKTTGGVQTLTVIVNDATSYCGISGNNYEDGISYSENADDLCMPNFSIERSGPTNVGDGTYKWVYTVTPLTPGP